MRCCRATAMCVAEALIGNVKMFCHSTVWERPLRLEIPCVPQAAVPKCGRSLHSAVVSITNTADMTSYHLIYDITYDIISSDIWGYRRSQRALACTAFPCLPPQGSHFRRGLLLRPALALLCCCPVGRRRRTRQQGGSQTPQPVSEPACRQAQALKLLTKARGAWSPILLDKCQSCG